MFDSGFGGLTVARAVIDLLPHENVVYFGDTGRYPYGHRDLDEVRGFAHEITRHLLEAHDVKMIVVACNTAAAAALGELQSEAGVPVVLSGGIATGRGLAAALALGAAGIQCGTAFVATDESFAHDLHKQRIVEADGADTLLTDAYVLNWPAGAAAIRSWKSSILTRYSRPRTVPTMTTSCWRV